jgi:hypothetical protein
VTRYDVATLVNLALAGMWVALLVDTGQPLCGAFAVWNFGMFLWLAGDRS